MARLGGTAVVFQKPPVKEKQMQQDLSLCGVIEKQKGDNGDPIVNSGTTDGNLVRLRQLIKAAACEAIATDADWLTRDDEILSDCAARDLMKRPEIVWG